MSNKEFHALAFLKWAKNILTPDQFEEVNKKAAPAAGGIAKKVNQLAKDRLEKAFLETPTNFEGLGRDSTLAAVEAKGSKFDKEDSDFQNLADFGFEACGGCTLYARDINGSEIGKCLVVEGDIPWFSTSKYFISGQEEAMASFRAMRQKERLSDIVESYSAPGEFRKEDYEYEIEIEFAKTDDDKKIVYGVVLEPMSIDTQNHMIFPEDIEQAAHDFLEKSRVVGTDHELIADTSIVESYIAPEDTTLEGQKVTKGTWIIASKVHSEDLWKQIKDGHYTGYSIGGTGQVITPISEKSVEE